VKRTYVYVDGFNLYYRALKKTKYKWLNLVSITGSKPSAFRRTAFSIGSFFRKIQPEVRIWRLAFQMEGVEDRSS
jgi:hypothetical protein